MGGVFTGINVWVGLKVYSSVESIILQDCLCVYIDRIIIIPKDIVQHSV